MDEPIYVMKSEINKYNHASCEVYEDRIVLTNSCDGGLFPVYENTSRTIPLSDIEKVVISKGGIHLIMHHPNCIHFVVHGSTRTVDSMFRDRAFHASDYISEGVFQLSPKSETDLDARLDQAKEIKRFIDARLCSAQKSH